MIDRVASPRSRYLPWLLLTCAVGALGLPSLAQAAAQGQPEQPGKQVEVVRRRRPLEIELAGRLQVDTAVHDADAARLDNSTRVRRARLALKGALFERLEFKAQAEFGGGVQLGSPFDYSVQEIEAKDIYVRYRFSKRLKVIGGHFKEPFSFEDQTSSKYTTFLERALSVDAFSPGRNLGVAVQQSSDHSSLAAGVFSGDGFGIAARSTWAPVSRKRRLLHLGVGGEYREPRDSEQARFRSRPESAVSGERLVSTRRLDDVNSTTRLGVEMAALAGPVSVQGEYILTRISRRNDTVAQLSGWYAALSWFPTGESRNYDVADGAFGKIKPRRGAGAVEVAARFSRLNLDDDDIRGGREDNITLAVNWYVTLHARLMANYVMVDAERRGDRDAPNIFQLRGQLSF